MADYTYWAAALDMTKGRRAVTREEMKSLGLNETDVGCGFFRKRNRDKAFLPVAIWSNAADEVVALVNGRLADSAAEVWTYCAPHPITEENYHDRVRGEPWPDEDKAATESLAHDPENEPADEAEVLADQIATALKGLKEYQSITDDEVAAKAQSLRARLNDLSGEAEKKHKVEKAPSLEEGRRIDKRWFSLRDEAKAGADAIRAALKAHENRKDLAVKMEEAKRLKALQDAERERLAAIEAGKPIPVAPTPPPPAPSLAPQTQIRGAYGKAASIRMVKVFTMSDQDAVYQFFKAQPEVTELLHSLAQKATKNGFAVPGGTVSEEKDVV